MITMAIVKNIPNPTAARKAIVALDPVVRRLFSIADEHAAASSPKNKDQLVEEFTSLLLGK